MALSSHCVHIYKHWSRSTTIVFMNLLETEWVTVEPKVPFSSEDSNPV